MESLFEKIAVGIELEPETLGLTAELMALIGIVFFHEKASWQHWLGILLSIAGLFLLRYSPAK